MVKFKDFSRPLTDFQVLFKANFIFNDFSIQPCIFKYFSRLCEPCLILVMQQYSILPTLFCCCWIEAAFNNLSALLQQPFKILIVIQKPLNFSCWTFLKVPNFQCFNNGLFQKSWVLTELKSLSEHKWIKFLM